ncbi:MULTISPECIES: hypothetical protein [unclassified Okeania]|uniref:hypothetical protein n=1 Tax=unclassified Okeania TaxID=2634635 RepID=UPI00257B6748|nr:MULTISPECIES: hypothetical protein [unclassified Okeania]
MSETTTTKPTKIEFIQYHQPALTDGDYEIKIEQKVTAGEKIPSSNKPFHVTKKFTVAGERFDLKPKDIHAVFPPAGSLGEHSNVLPHIILNRSTLPWERMAIANNNNIPWLALLLFDEEEKPEPKIITLRKLKQIPDHIHLDNQDKLNAFLKSDKTSKKIWLLNDDLTETEISTKSATGRNIYFPNFDKETGQHWDDKVTVIDVPGWKPPEDLKDLDEKNLLDKILPTKADLAYLAHVRQGTDNNGKLVGDELAVIIGNRLPKKGHISTVHLVSIEGRYDDKGFNFQQAENNDYIRLVSLKSWRFACVDEKQSFKGLLTNINLEPSTLRLPKVDNAEAEGYLSMGYLPLPHFLRQGGKTFSWYHSPLITGNNPTNNITLPIRAADELVRYNPNNGMFDISYAAAWELGRLLALQSKNFSISLYQWKRSHRHGQIIQDTESHLPFYNQSNTELPDAIASWFTNLSLLKGVPFNYLVPDEQMLPVESIRFFWIDPLWIECLLDGAFSIGRVTTSDHAHDSSHSESPAAKPHETVTGFLLRSDVVAGWPGLLVDGYDQVVDNDNAIDDQEKLPLLRMDRLSANVLICLFDGEVKTVDIHQKPETIHFGLDSDDDDGRVTFYKKLKDSDGKPVKKADQRRLEIPDQEEPPKWKDRSKNILNIANLAEAIKNKVNFNSFTSAQFALEMIEGVEKVRFTIGTKN